MSIYNSVEEELWRIFSFYTLHSDPNTPDIMRLPSFVRFCKDCQLVSKRLTTQALELEVSKHTTGRSYQGVGDNSSAFISFPIFLELIESIAFKVYSNDIPDVAVRRVVLENVLLLANRRIPLTDLYDLEDKKVSKLLNEVLGKGLREIFSYYIDKAKTRRKTAVSNEKMALRDMLRREVGHVDSDSMAWEAASPDKKRHLFYLQNVLASQKELISYKEFLQFSLDFNLKSTNLLSAIQVGELYLSVIPRPKAHGIDKSSSKSDMTKADYARMMESFELPGMGVELFLRALSLMGQYAFRELDRRVPVHFKVKALLMYMWKVVQDSTRTMKVLNQDRTAGLVSTGNNMSGSLCLYGSGTFFVAFQALWQRDGFIEYSLPPPEDAVSGSTMLRKVIGEVEGRPSPPPPVSHAVVYGAAPAIVKPPAPALPPRSPSPGKAHMIIGASIASSGGDEVDDVTDLFTLPVVEVKQPQRHESVVTIKGSDLQNLFRKKPEIAEYVYLEIQNMKVELSRLTTSATE